MSASAPALTTDHTALLQLSTALLTQALDLLSRLPSPSSLSQPSALIPGSTIGKHLRHAYAHFTLLLDGMDGGAAVDYDARQRGLAMERDLEACRAVTRELIERLESEGSKWEMGREVTLSATTPMRQTFSTTYGRELWFAALHAIHHYSMIRVLAVAELKIDLSEDFGVAPSTLVHRAETEEAAAGHGESARL